MIKFLRIDIFYSKEFSHLIRVPTIRGISENFFYM